MCIQITRDQSSRLKKQEAHLGHGSETCGVAKHVGEGDLSLYDHIFCLCFTVLDEPLAPVHIPDDGALELGGRPDLLTPGLSVVRLSEKAWMPYR